MNKMNRMFIKLINNSTKNLFNFKIKFKFCYKKLKH